MSFRVPEGGRLSPADHALLGSTVEVAGQNGAFVVPSPEPGWLLFLICSDGIAEDAVGDLADWEHVSVSARSATRPLSRVPTWKEMCHVKRLCWDAEDVVVQYHPREADYINVHPHVLHLWRWRTGTFPTPPKTAVG